MRRAAAAGLLAIMACAAAGPVGTAETPRPAVPLVRIPFPQDDGALTPYSFELGYSLVTLVYDTVMWRDDRGVAQPWLATSVDLSPDAQTVTIRLHDQVHWHDGQALNAGDVAFTLRYVAAHPHPRFTPEVAAISKVSTPDPTTVVIALRQPSPGFLDQTLADLPILPAHLWQSLPAGQVQPKGLPVGSGPYRLAAHDPGKRYHFDANSDYFRGPPTVTAIEIPVINDAEATFQAFEAHTVDMVPVSLPQAQVDRLNAIGDRVVHGPMYLGAVLMFNLRQPPFDNPNVRHAISQALDPAGIAVALGNSVAASRGYLHPDSPWAPPKDVHTVDTRAAAQTLGSLNLAPIEVLAPNNDGVKMEAAHQIVIALQRAGLRAGVKSVARQDLFHAVGEDGSTPSFTAAIWNDYPLASYDPDFLTRTFGSGPTGFFNYPGYHNPAFDDLANRVAITTDPVSRRSLVSDELRLLSIDAPVVPLYFPVGSFAYRPAVYDGWVFIKGGGILDKRSFAVVAAATRSSPPAPAGTRPPVASSGGIPTWLGLGALGFVIIAIAGAIYEFARRR